MFGDPESPRRVFLAELVRMRNVPPECLLIRKDLSTRLDLNHRGLGDAIGEVLAKVLPRLPELGELLLAGNRWSDDTIAAIRAATNCPFEMHGRRDSSPRNIRVPDAASPRLVSTKYPRRSRGVAATRLHGTSTRQSSSIDPVLPRRRRSSNRSSSSGPV